MKRKREGESCDFTSFLQKINSSLTHHTVDTSSSKKGESKTSLVSLFAEIIPSPLGDLIALSNDKELIYLEFYEETRHEKILKFLKTFSNQTCSIQLSRETTSPLESIKLELEEYFAGKLKTFRTPILLDNGTEFQIRIWDTLLQIPFAQTCSYAQLAARAEVDGAWRAAANANGANHFVIVVPCHRVVRTNGNIGGYGGGCDRKLWLLEHEKKFKEKD